MTMTLVETLALNSNPFEGYTAETEPNIADYAIRPPYLQAIAERVRNCTSFILFGDRGAGKSATRITVYKEIWKVLGEKNSPKSPFVVNLTDFSKILDIFKQGKLTERDIIGVVSFSIVEQILVWLSSLEEDERNTFIEGLNKDERTLVLALIQGFYLSIPDMDRTISTTETLKLLNSAWTTKSTIWLSKRWDALSRVVSSVVSALSKKELGESMDISEPAALLLKSLVGSAPTAPMAILGKLVEFVRAFGYSGVSILVDKVDETPATANSSEATARLLYPLLSHVQLLEVDGFSWIFFLWSSVKDHFNQKFPVRLDKIAHADITWKSESLRQMLEARIRFFSGGNLSFKDLFFANVNVDEIFVELESLAVSSPRELIKLMDIIFREHDARGDVGASLLDQISVDIGQDKYAKDTIGTWFSFKVLQQVLRLGKTSFINKDVQGVFKISDQGARVKIKSWEDVGLVRQSGTMPSEQGNKQSNRYIVSDKRVERIIIRKLDEVVGKEIEQAEFEHDVDNEF